MFKEYIINNQDLIIKDLIELIKIETIHDVKKPNMPYGEGIYRGLRYVLDKGNDLKFKTQNFCGHCGHLEVGNGAYTVGILCNVDVSSEVKGWTKNPFQGEIVENKIYGKGAIDGKGPLIACLYAMKILNDENLIPEDKKIRMIIGSDKKTTCKSINYYKEYEEAPEIGFTPDGVFPVVYGEKGIIDLSLEMQIPSNYDSPINIVEISGGKKGEGVPEKVNIIVSCDEIFKMKIEEELKMFADEEKIDYNIFSQNKLVSIEFIGKVAPRFSPEKGLNPISYGIKFLSRFDEFIDRKDFINEYEKHISISYNGEKINCFLQGDESGEFTFNVEEINLLNDSVKIEVNITHPISYLYSQVLEQIKEGFKYSTLQITDIEHLRPVTFSKDSFVVKKLMKAYRQVTGDKDSEPYTTAEGSYARAISNTIAFGPIFPNETHIKDGPDEFISIDSLLKLVEIYAIGIYELLR